MNYYETQPGGIGSTLADSVDTMIRLPLKMTEGTVDAVIGGMRWMTNGFRQTGTADRMQATSYGDTTRTTKTTKSSGESGASMFSRFTSMSDQDLGGADLKYVVWSIVFTKPGHECVLERQHEEIVSYEADANSFAAIKIAKFIESARNGRAEKPETFNERNYPPAEASSSNGRRGEANAFASNGAQQQTGDKGFRIPAEDQRFVTFLYRVERRLPKMEEEVTRVERVTVERGHTSHTAVA
ncbi:MAG TPA: hypothetical protein VHZ73_09110 [Vicinamibacterales bacterium]|nr:hypothetical protein [Vicinamibacterales bacterium]